MGTLWSREKAGWTGGGDICIHTLAHIKFYSLVLDVNSIQVTYVTFIALIVGKRRRTTGHRHPESRGISNYGMELRSRNIKDWHNPLP